MFERRLKYFLAILAVLTAVLVLRAGQVQLVEHDEWSRQNFDDVQHVTYIETSRGTITDCKGVEIARDEPCIDVAVDYRAILHDPDPDWVAQLAKDRAQARPEWKRAGAGRKAILQSENQWIRDHIELMWTRLATEAHMSSDAMDDLRNQIVAKVQAHKRFIQQRKFQEHQQQLQNAAATQPVAVPWYRRWLFGDTAPVETVDSFDIVTPDETTPFVIMHSISPDTYNRLGKDSEQMPGLVLRSSTKRVYPLGEVGCHLLGRLSRVEADDVKDDPYIDDPLRRYGDTDLIGHGGLEGLCETLLRGTRGQITRTSNSARFADTDNSDTEDDTPTTNPSNHGWTEDIQPAKPGQKIATTIDFGLEKEIEDAFRHVNEKRDEKDPDLFVDMHGAAVVIDIPTGAVRALVSMPGFDPNTFDAMYQQLASDDINHPLLNRATQSMTETGSTMKPVVGIGALMDGKIRLNDTVKCDGFLYFNGHKLTNFRCWTMSEYKAAGHVIPYNDPHPTGNLNFSDALQRSCDVFFETMGQRLGIDRLKYWMETFGLGHITGVGIPEVRGRLPGYYASKLKTDQRLKWEWWDGIGQGEDAATPIQMANVAATIARNGIWMRPRLVTDDISQALRHEAAAHPTTEPTEFNWMDVPDRRDLNLTPAIVADAQDGMYRVVNTFAGTGNILFDPYLEVSGKTGTAEAAPFNVPVRDAHHQIIYDGNKPRLVPVDPSLPERPNPQAPWYLGFEHLDKNNKTIISLKHGWYIGYAPSHHPTIAFVLFVEYGGGGGGTASGSIAQKMIDACIQRGYVAKDAQPHEKVP